jgi:hypothetical protein
VVAVSSIKSSVMPVTPDKLPAVNLR